MSELLNSETYYGYDLNLDNNIGDRIANVIGSNGSNKSLYQTSTGAYIIDEINLIKDDFTVNPVILIKEKIYCTIMTFVKFKKNEKKTLCFMQQGRLVPGTFVHIGPCDQDRIEDRVLKRRKMSRVCRNDTFIDVN